MTGPSHSTSSGQSTSGDAAGSTDDALVLFLHVPKTGGSTLTELISGEYAVTGVDGERVHQGVLYYPTGFELEKWDRPSPPPSIRATLGRQDLAAVVGHFHFGLHAYTKRPCRYVTVLRDPVERMLSLHHHMRRHYHLEMDFEEFVRQPPLREADNGQTRRLAGELLPLGDVSEDVLQRALDHLGRIDVVGVTDRFDETLIVLAHDLSWPRTPPVYFPRNVEPDRIPANDLPTATRTLIQEHNRFDVELYAAARRRLATRLDGAEPALIDAIEAYKRRRAEFSDILDARARSFVTALDERHG